MFACTALLAACLLVQDHSTPPSPNSTTQADTLDPRIDHEKIKSLEPAPIPGPIVRPLAPSHRVATSPEQVPVSDVHWTKAHEALKKGLAFLRSVQGSNGAWLHAAPTTVTDAPDKPIPMSVAVTAMGVRAFLQAPQDLRSDSVVETAFQYIMLAHAEDGSFDPSGDIANYVTSLVASALAASEDSHYEDELREAIVWLKKSQWDESEGVSPTQDWYGGAGYGHHGRPDLSNTQMMLEALYDAGVSPDEPAVQRAVAFLSRTQNLKLTNTSDWAQAGANDGGFVYTPVNGGESMASDAAGEGRKGEKLPAGSPRSLRSYGSMTYAGFKSMLYAGLAKDDPRVVAAYDWIRKHFTFDENPGMGQQGLFYYYNAMSRALRAAQQDEIADEQDNSHNWREELIDAIVSRQASDGSWKNSATRWEEGRPELATIDALLAIEEALKPVRDAQ